MDICNVGKCLWSTDPSQKQEVNRNAFAKFDKEHTQSKATSAAESDPTVRYNGKNDTVTVDISHHHTNSIENIFAGWRV